MKAAVTARVRESWAARSEGNDPLTVEAVFPEWVLRQVVGGLRLMKAQLLRLRVCCASRSHCHLLAQQTLHGCLAVYASGKRLTRGGL